MAKKMCMRRGKREKRNKEHAVCGSYQHRRLRTGMTSLRPGVSGWRRASPVGAACGAPPGRAGLTPSPTPPRGPAPLGDGGCCLTLRMASGRLGSVQGAPRRLLPAPSVVPPQVTETGGHEGSRATVSRQLPHSSFPLSSWCLRRCQRRLGGREGPGRPPDSPAPNPHCA